MGFACREHAAHQRAEGRIAFGAAFNAGPCPPAVFASNLTKTYGNVGRGADRVALQRCSLTVPVGQTLGIIGPNGSGKTTLLLLLLGFLFPDEGDVQIFGTLPNSPGIRNTIGYLPETFTPPGELSGYKYLWTLARLYGYSARAADDRVREVARQCELSARLNECIRQYSKGLIRRLGVARAFVNEPRLVLLDEPTISLDPTSVLGLRNILSRACERGATVVMVSHHLSEVAEICDRVVLLRNGTIRNDQDLKGDHKDLFELFESQEG